MINAVQLDSDKLKEVRPITIEWINGAAAYMVAMAGGETAFSADHDLIADLIATHDMVLATDRPRFVLAVTVDGEHGYDWVHQNTTIDPCDQIIAWRGI